MYAELCDGCGEQVGAETGTECRSRATGKTALLCARCTLQTSVRFYEPGTMNPGDCDPTQLALDSFIGQRGNHNK